MKLYEALTELKRNNFKGYVFETGRGIGMWSYLIIADYEKHFRRISIIYALKGLKGRALSICGSAELTQRALCDSEWFYFRDYKFLYELYLGGIKSWAGANWFRKELYTSHLEEGLKWGLKHGKITTYEADKIKEEYYGIVNSTV